MDGIFFVVDAGDLQRLSVAQEVLQEMARHPGLYGRQIPLIILSNKQDLAEKVDEVTLRQILQVERLKNLNTSMRFYVKDTIGLTCQGINECFQMFEGQI